MFHRQPEAALALSFDARLLAQSGYTVFAAGNADRIQVAPGLERPVGLPTSAMGSTNVRKQGMVRLHTGARRTPAPIVIAAARDLQHEDQCFQAIPLAMLLNEGVLHLRTFAKYASVFFRMSRSSVMRASSRLSLAFSTLSGSWCFPSLLRPGP